MTTAAEARELARTFTTEDPQWQADPYPAYAAMRDHCPVAHTEGQGNGFWMVTKFTDVRHVLTHPETYSSNDAQIDEDGMGQARPLIPIQIDPPQHAEYRRVLAAYFTRARALRFEPQVRQVTRMLLDRIAHKGECDFNEEFAKPLPSFAFVEYVGWPREDADLFHEWAHQAIHGDGKGGKAAAAASIYNYFSELVAERRAKPADDVISELIGSNRHKRELSDQEVIDVMFLLVLAGFDTTRKTLGLSVAYLAEHHELRDQLTNSPSLIPTAVEEMLRWESIVTVVRTVEQDVELGGQQLRAGEKMMIPLGSAGRDSDEFPNADTFDLKRLPNRHMAFGHGPHRCLGMHFARLELQVALEELHKRLPDYRLPPGGDPIRTLHPARGIERLPLIFTAA